MSIGLIVSLGGTPEPVAKTIAEHRPQVVCYFASKKSVLALGTVHSLLAGQDVSVEDFEVVLVNDVNDMVHCFEKALECARFFERKGVPPGEVVVDYTGGTKTMSAAMALATVRKGFSFSYVGGSERTKGGLGTVVSGAEVVYSGVSPWQIFAVEEWQHIVLQINHYHYEAATLELEEMTPRQPPSQRECLAGLRGTIQGLLMWDRFNHKKALPELRDGIEKLDRWGRISGDDRFTTFVAAASENLRFLQEMASATQGFQRVKRPTLIDLLSNADRRAAQGRYDDGMARLYRALEMRGQIAFENRTGLSTSAVTPDCLPPELKEEYMSRYQSPETGKLQLGLFATFRLLHALDDPAGFEFMANQDAFTKVLFARNQSVLAHGVLPVTKETFETFRNLLRNSFQIQETVTFPKLRSPI